MNNFIIFLHITNLCNYTCEYCSEGLPQQANESKWSIPLNLVKYINYMIIQYLTDFNVHICLIGGEPLLYPYLQEVIQLFEQNPLIKGLYILTNNSIDISNIIKSKTTIPMYFSFSMHTESMKKFDFNKQMNIFIDNIKYLERTIANFKYVIEILHDMREDNSYHTSIEHYLAAYFDRSKIYQIPIHSTPWYNSHTDEKCFVNPMYNQNVAVNSYFTITKNTKMNKWYIVNDCNMVKNITSVYDVAFWKRLSKSYYEKVICNTKICLCRYCMNLIHIKEMQGYAE